MKRYGRPLLTWAVAWAIVAWAPSPVTRSADADPRAQAITLYAQGRYAEARPLLEELAEEEGATGPLLYRLAYCQRTAGDSAASAQTERRALEALERELANSDDIEVPFYLVNTYQNGGRPQDAKRVAAESTERLEQGQIARPDSGRGQFQVGKLYADQGREEPAAEWYAKAVEALTGDGSSGDSYLRRASRFLAERAWRLRDFDAAQKYYGSLIAAGEGGGTEFDRMAVARARVGMFAEAAEAWHEAGRKLGPVNADRYRYCGRLATLADQLGELPPAAPDGRTWDALGQAELEALLTEQTERVKAILGEAARAETRTKEDRKAARKALREPKGILVAAALEYALRGYGIRQAAFFGGYAPLILKPSAWRIPRPAQPEGAEGEGETTAGTKDEKKKGKKKRGS